MIRPLLGGPYVDLAPFIDLRGLEDIDDEVCAALSELQTDYTGGSHRSMGIVPPSLLGESWVDYGEVIAKMKREEFARFIGLGDEPIADFDLDGAAGYEFGEEREHPLSRAQMRYLELKHRVYFPWKHYYELMPNDRWDDKSDGVGKQFTDEAKDFFPRTIALVKRLPFVEIGRCNLLGLAANDFGTVHRDGDPAEKPGVDHFITIAPRGDKRLFLWDEERQERHFVHGRAYWFDDSNYHGVAADPFFRYSIRIDGVFDETFLARLRDTKRAA